MSTRIMIVDDEEVTGRLLLYQLQGLGYTAVYVQDGLQALQQILIEQPHLILLDVMMPLVSGWDVCREIRSCSSVPIIMVTGKDADDDLVVGLAAGADDYVTKPFNMVQLHARIEAVLRRAGQRSHWDTAAAVRRPSVPDMSMASIPRANSFQQPVFAAAPQTVLSARVAPVAVAQRIEQPSQPYPRPVSGVVKTKEYAPVTVARPMLLGARLQAERQARGISLYQAEQMCLVRWDYLQAIEQENWTYLPRPLLHKTIRQYAAFLRVDPGPALAPARHSWPLWQYTAIMAGTLVLLLIVIMLLARGVVL